MKLFKPFVGEFNIVHIIEILCMIERAVPGSAKSGSAIHKNPSIYLSIDGLPRKSSPMKEGLGTFILL